MPPLVALRRPLLPPLTCNVIYGCSLLELVCLAIYDHIISLLLRAAASNWFFLESCAGLISAMLSTLNLKLEPVLQNRSYKEFLSLVLTWILQVSRLTLLKSSAVWLFGFCSQSNFACFLFLVNSKHPWLKKKKGLFLCFPKFLAFYSADVLIISLILTHIHLH